MFNNLKKIKELERDNEYLTQLNYYGTLDKAELEEKIEELKEEMGKLERENKHLKHELFNLEFKYTKRDTAEVLFYYNGFQKTKTPIGIKYYKVEEEDIRIYFIEDKVKIWQEDKTEIELSADDIIAIHKQLSEIEKGKSNE